MAASRRFTDLIIVSAGRYLHLSTTSCQLPRKASPNAKASPSLSLSLSLSLKQTGIPLFLCFSTLRWSFRLQSLSVSHTHTSQNQRQVSGLLLSMLAPYAGKLTPNKPFLTNSTCVDAMQVYLPGILNMLHSLQISHGEVRAVVSSQ